METKFKDVAGFYLGCDAQLDNSGSKVIKKIVAVGGVDDYPYIKLRLGSPEKGHVHSVFLSEDRAKPILRPISDITEPEMKDLYFIVFGKDFCGDNITHRDIGEKRERWVLWSGVERLFIYKDGDIGADSDLSYYTVHQPSVMLYLLKQGFDLFNLIESKQAIDKTTLTTTQTIK